MMVKIKHVDKYKVYMTLSSQVMLINWCTSWCGHISIYQRISKNYLLTEAYKHYHLLTGVWYNVLISFKECYTVKSHSIWTNKTAPLDKKNTNKIANDRTTRLPPTSGWQNTWIKRWNISSTIDDKPVMHNDVTIIGLVLQSWRL